MQVVFLIGALINLGMLVPFTTAAMRFAQKAQANKPENYEWPQWTDFKITAIWSVIFGIIELLSKKYLGPFFYGVCKEQKDLKMRALRS